MKILIYSAISLLALIYMLHRKVKKEKELTSYSRKRFEERNHLFKIQEQRWDLLEDRYDTSTRKYQGLLKREIQIRKRLERMDGDTDPAIEELLKEVTHEGFRQSMERKMLNDWQRTAEATR